MPSKNQIDVKSFSQGLITESSPLNFPDKSSFDEVNMELLRKGTRQRRLGLDIEPEGTVVSTGFTDAQRAVSLFNFFDWPSPSGSVKVHAGVVQSGNRIYFIDLSAVTQSTSFLNGGSYITVDIEFNAPLQFSIFNNDLVYVASGLNEVHRVSYDDVTDAMTDTSSKIEIRDFYGVDEGFTTAEESERPGGDLTQAHFYNLRNQGWSDKISTTYADHANNAIGATFAVLGVWPSNADTWSLGKIADTSDADIDKFDPQTLKNNSMDVGLAPKGRYIIDLYNRGASRELLADRAFLPIDRELGRISVAASYAGRMFYSGIKSNVLGGDENSLRLENAILYSQITASNSDISKCYQVADPTSPDNSDLVDTDGGLIFVTGAVGIIRLIPVKTNLFIFARNGVWLLKGEDGGFKATSFQVQKISSIGAFSPNSIVEANGSLFFWAEGGIYALAPDQFGESYEATSATITTIQSMYDSLPDFIKKEAKGWYDQKENVIRWLYASDESKIVGNPIDIYPALPAVRQVGAIANLDVASTFIDIVSLTATKSIITFAVASVLHAVVLNISGVTITLGAHVNLGPAAFSTSVCRLTDSTAIVAYHTTGNLGHAAVLTISGDSIVMGTAASIGSIAAVPSLHIEPINSTKVVAGYKNLAATDNSVQVLSISGTTVTPGTPKIVNTTTGHTYTNLCMISATKGLITSFRSAGGNHIIGVVFDISGTTVTNGIEYNVSPGGEVTSANTEPRHMSGNKVLCTWRGGSSIIKNSYVSVTGTVITLTSTTSLSELGTVYAHTMSDASEQTIVYSNPGTLYPHVNINGVGVSFTEGTPTLLASDASVEMAIHKISTKKVVFVYRNSASYLRTMAMNT